MAKTNPNGANQWVADPRQTLFLTYYLDPKSPTFSNALQSGLKAGFEESYAMNILDKMPNWLLERVEKLKSSNLLAKAERNLDEMLELPNKTQAIGAFGPLWKKKSKKVKDKDGKFVTKQVDTSEPVMVHAVGLLKVKADVTKFVAERIGKSKYGTENHNDGNRILIINISGQSSQRYGAHPSPSTDSA